MSGSRGERGEGGGATPAAEARVASGGSNGEADVPAPAETAEDRSILIGVIGGPTEGREVAVAELSAVADGGEGDGERTECTAAAEGDCSAAAVALAAAWFATSADCLNCFRFATRFSTNCNSNTFGCPPCVLVVGSFAFDVPGVACVPGTAAALLVACVKNPFAHFATVLNSSTFTCGLVT
jgi:hypothetical protein